MAEARVRTTCLWSLPNSEIAGSQTQNKSGLSNAYHYITYAFSALTLLVGRQEGHLA